MELLKELGNFTFGRVGGLVLPIPDFAGPGDYGATAASASYREILEMDKLGAGLW